MENNLDKRFLLTYTAKGEDEFAHFYHAWFKSEGELKAFIQEEEKKGREPEIDLAIEILDYRSLDL